VLDGAAAETTALYVTKKNISGADRTIFNNSPLLFLSSFFIFYLCMFLSLSLSFLVVFFRFVPPTFFMSFCRLLA